MQQRLGPLQEEEVWVIWELATVQGRVKQPAIEAEDKLTNLIAQSVEEITTTKVAIIKEVEGAKAASQNLILAWKSRQQSWVAWDEAQVSVGGMLDRKSWK